MALRESDDPYWMAVDGLSEVPLSARRRTEPETDGGVEDDVITDLKLRALFLHHLRDWLVIILCIILDTVLNIIHPFYRFVGQANIDSVSLPLKKNTVPLWSVPIIAIAIPFTVFVGFFVVRRNTRDLHQALLGLLTAVGITAVITDAIKDGVGRARPDFLFRCFPDGVAVYSGLPFNEVVCNGDPATIREGHKSFPSGHSSWSFAGLGYLSFYLAGKVMFFDRRGYSSRIAIVLFPLLVAAMVAVSRVSDYWHHWQDVTVGSLLGFIVAYISYKQHFPEFSDKLAGYPYPHMQHRSTSLPITSRTNPRVWGTNPPAPARANAGPYDVGSGHL